MITFCIWIFNNKNDNIIEFEKYLIRMNTVMLSLYKDNNKLEFIIYTNSPIKVISSILKYELTFMKCKVKVTSISLLIDIYYEYVKEAIILYKQRIVLQVNNSNLNPINYDAIDNIQFDDKPFKLRDNYQSWSLLYPSYLLRLLHNGLFLARASLCLRLIALSQHGGLYLDFDVLCIKNIQNNKLNNILKTKIQYEKELYKFQKKNNNYNNNHGDDPRRIGLIVQFSKKIHSLLHIPLILKKNDNISTVINDFKSMIELDLSQRIKNCINEYINTNHHQQHHTHHIYNNGVYAISSKTIKKNEGARFSQNVMFTDSCHCTTMKQSFYHSIYFNMMISTIEPGFYVYHKTNSIQFICPIDDENLNRQLSDILLPSDIFLSRCPYPYLIKNNDDILMVTYRNGRPLHPLGQLSTRGCWNFIKMKQFITSSSEFVQGDKFSAIFDRTHLFPESSLLSEEHCSYKNSHHHWTKLKNQISII